MSDGLVIIIPSRGRPHIVAELDEALESTCSIPSTLAVLALDEDDTTFDDYEHARQGAHRIVTSVNQPTGTMVSALNSAVAEMSSGFFAVGFMGDDHRPRTIGWDKAYLDALRELGTGIVYGDDLLQRANLPTQCAMTADIAAALGYMAPPELTHMFVDNFWLDLGRAAGCIRYLPEVVVEHMHPIAGKAEWSEGHARVNHPAMYQRDGAAYALYRGARFADDVAKVKALREVAA